jgi:hypothetical protein
VGHWRACGDTRCEVDGERGLSRTGVAVENDEFPERQAAGPEPLDTFKFHSVEPGNDLVSRITAATVRRRLIANESLELLDSATLCEPFRYVATIR